MVKEGHGEATGTCLEDSATSNRSTGCKFNRLELELNSEANFLIMFYFIISTGIRDG